jgi:glycosyltransferase involved in cell wall biosynthesis
VTQNLPALSVVLCTYNRASLLADALDALVAQQPDTPRFEVIVVDNNSTDETAVVVADTMRRHRHLRYIFEPRQGLASARNAGIEAAVAPLVSFTDDDVRVARNWVAAIVAAFAEFPGAEWLGGKVVPQWPTAPPAWLERTSHAPLALVDHGDEAFPVSATRPICLVGANLAVRRRAFARVGLFDPRVERRGDGIGSTEDHELQLRLWQAGLHGYYDPRMVVSVAVPPERLKKSYHRAWHDGHGRFCSVMRDPAFERSRARLLGVPIHVFRAMVGESCAFVADLVRHRRAEAFGHELRLRFLVGFTRHRLRDAVRSR